MYTIDSLYLSLFRQAALSKLGKIQARDSFSVISEFSLSPTLSVREGEMRKNACLNWLTSSQLCF